MNRTEEQRRAVETTGHNLCVDAGAGSGKTSVLVDRILYLIEHKRVPLDAIVAITFTDKAAAEMKERLRRECHRRAPEDDSQKMTFWRTLERRTDSARISTIHAFCMGLLKENALSLGMDPDFSMLSDAESHLMRAETVEGVLHALLQSEDEGALRLATVFGVPRVKTIMETMLRDRSALERMLASEALQSPAELLARWRERVNAVRLCLLRQLQESSELATLDLQLEAYAGACTKQDDGREQMRVKLLEIISMIRSATDTQALCAAAVELAACDGRRGSKKNWESEDAFEGVKDVRDTLKPLLEAHHIPSCAEGVECEAAQVTFDMIGVFGQVVEGLRGAKRHRTAFDFDDLIMETLKVLQDDSRGEDSVRARTARSIRHLLIDEFQDTDGAQLEIARLLTGESGGPELFIVGDAKQSIYQFRGAEVDVFREARAEASETIPLALNFRSLPDVMAFANDFFAKSELLSDVEAPYKPMGAFRSAEGGAHVEILMPEIIEDAKTSEYRDAEANLLAGRVIEMCHGETAASIYDDRLKRTRAARFGDVAILLRSFSDVHQYERAFRLAGIPYAVVAGSGFYERQEVADFRNLLTVLDDPWNEMALIAFLRSPIVGLSDTSLMMLTLESSLARAFHSGASIGNEEQDARLSEAKAILADLNDRRQEPLLELLRYALERTGLEAIYLSQFLGVQRASNIRKVLELVTSFSRTSAPSLGAFVRYLEDVAAAEIKEGEAAVQIEGADAVTIMTIHKAKGLEFPIVAIADMARGPNIRQSLPVTWHRHFGIAARTLGDDGEYQECPMYRIAQSVREREERAERARILYVAMTRARDYLLLCGAPEQERERNNSWFAVFRELYDLPDRADGDEFGGPGWKAVVRRISAGHRIPEMRIATTPPSRDDILRRVAPVTAPGMAPDGMSVTRVAALLNVLPAMETTEAAGSGERTYALLRGSLAHKVLELWDFRSNPADLIARLTSTANVSAGERERLRHDLLGIAKRFSNSDLATRLANASGMREAPFVLRLGSHLVHGIIDFVLDDGTIIDYKTGTHHPHLHAHYETQIRFYAAAVRVLCGLEPPGAFLCYIDAAEGEWISPVDVSAAVVDATLAQAAAALNSPCAPWTDENSGGIAR